MKPLLRLLRVRQWVKNLFVLLPLLFGGALLSRHALAEGLEAFCCFCLAASGVYVFNDLADLRTDRLHPAKRLRPLASCAVSPKLAAVVGFVTMALSLVGAWLLFPDIRVAISIAFYLLINLLYSLGLKRLAIVDVIIIAVGFVLRVLAGGYACSIHVSPWLVTMVFLLTLFIAFGKRRDDLLQMESSGSLRRSVEAYDISFVDHAMTLLSAAMIVAYVIYTLSAEVIERFDSQNVYLTSVFVIAGTLRYMQLAFVKRRTGDPTEIVYRDSFMLCCVVLWILSFVLIIYG